MVERIPLGLVNAYLLRGKKGDILVDTGLPGSFGRLLRLLRRAGSSPEGLALVVLTHVHLDHVGNLPALQRLARVPVLVHRLEAPVLQSGRVVLPAGQTAPARALMGVAALPAALLRCGSCRPDLVVEDEMSLAPFGLAGKVLHTPGHTAGSLSVLLETGEAVIGDLGQNGWGFGLGLGRIALPLADLPGAVPSSWTRLLESGATRFHPGHGRPFGADELRCLR